MRAYPAALTPDPDGGFTVTFRDVPEAITEGDTWDEALLRAEDALESALARIVATYEPLPTSRGLARDKVNTYVHRVTSAEFKRWLERQGASFGPAKGGHIWVVLLAGRRSYQCTAAAKR